MNQSSLVLPAKLSRPSAVGLDARERLFALLDRFRRRPIVWVEGPPGAGKTSLVSSWIEARGLPCLWYQVDEGDADPASFFHYLRQAARPDVASLVPLAPLPALTPEYLPDLPGFTRRFFKALLERMPSLALIVLDNFQESPDDSPLATLVQDVSTALPEGVALVVISRLGPPAAFARAIAHADLARVNWDDLRLDVEETRLMARIDSAADEDRARSLHQRTGGWAAGLRLMLESGVGVAAVPTNSAETPEALFDYLALEVFDRSPLELRELWLATACLPRFTSAMADALTERQGTGEWLERLASQRYFIERRAAPAVTYQYHALFGEFLRRQVKRHRDEATQRRLAHLSAALLAEAGEAESAFRLYCEVADFEGAIPLILQEAPALLAQGRWQTLQASLATLPEPLLDEVPWLTFWLGAARGMTNPPLARATLERAHRRFVETGDLAGQAMSIGAVIESYFAEWDHLAQLDPWIEAAERLIVASISFPAPAAELRFWSSLLVALVHCQPSSPLAGVVTDRTFELLELDLGVNEKLAAGAHLLYYLSLSGKLHAAKRLAEALKPLLDQADVTPLIRLSMQSALMMHAFHVDNSTRALEINRQAQQIIRDNGFVFANGITRLFEVWALAHQGDFEAASALLEETAPHLDRARPNEIGLSHFIKSWFALWRGDSRAALHHAEFAMQTIAGREAFAPLVCCNSAMALAATACGDRARADEAIARNRVCIEGQDRGAPRIFVLLVEADVLLRSARRTEGRDALREALATARRTDCVHACIWLPDMWARLCAEALQAGIETDVAARLITSRGLRSPSPDIEAWPWPIRIHTLGRFEVVVNGEVVRHVHKAQRRVLDLLKALVALGVEGVSRDAIAAALWPDSEGDAARDAFGVTLHRLRKLLGRDDAIHLLHGKLELNTTIVWADSLAFERLANQANGDGAAFDIDAAERALTLYAGPLLHKEEDAPWLLPARERLRSRYVRLALSTAHHFESNDRGDLSVKIYISALEAEPLAEEVYRRLMTCLASQGRQAEALDVYRRCRHMLSVVLGVMPSRTTEELHQAIAKAA